MRFRNLILNCLIFISTAHISYSQQLSIGQSVPDFDLKYVGKNQSPKKKISEFKGRFIILDFWATWCGPCQRTMPYIERIKEQFGDTLQVFAVSDESYEEINHYVKSKETSVYFIQDVASKITQKFGISAIPASVLIDSYGKVKAVGNPLNFTPSLIKQIMANQPIQLVDYVHVDDNNVYLKDTPKGQKFNVEIYPYKPKQPSFFKTFTEGEYSGRRLYFSNMTIKSIYEYLYHLPNRGILKVPSLAKYSDGAEASNLFCVDIIVNEADKSKLFQVGIEEMHKRFKLKSRMEVITSNVKVLKVQDPSRLPISGFENEPENRSLTFDKLSELLSSYNTFGMPVVHESAYNQRFRINFDALPDDPYLLINRLSEFGLTIRDEVRQIPMLILYEN